MIYAVANQKGGVGKTTTVNALSAAFAERGARVLVIDLDPQAGLTVSYGINPDALPQTMYQVLIDTDKANEHFKSEGIVDASIPVRLDYDEIETVKATTRSFGRPVPRNRMARLLWLVARSRRSSGRVGRSSASCFRRASASA